MIINFIEIFILSVVQGISEFLPISSSAHLILISNMYDLKSNSLIIDVSLHFGSLLAIITYFRKELLNLRNNRKLITLIVIGSIPLVLFGYIFYTTELIQIFRNIKVIAWTTFIFAIILYFADKKKSNKTISADLNLKSILVIGLFQILALIPGVSRSGITLTAARYLNFSRVDSTKIAFLLSIPALGGASVLGLKEVINEYIDFNFLILVSIILFFNFSFLTIKFFLSYVNKFNLNLFIIYRIFISFVLFIVIYF